MLLSSDPASPAIDVAALASYLAIDDLAQDSRAELLIELTNGLIEEVCGEGPYPAHVAAVALEVAARAYRNPDGFSSETIDDYTYRRDAATRQAGVYLTDEERSRLCGGAPRVKMGWLA